MIFPLLPRLPESHKGNYGHILVIGGDLAVKEKSILGTCGSLLGHELFSYLSLS